MGMSDLNDDLSLRILKRVGFYEAADNMFRRMHHVGFVPPRGDFYRDSGDLPYSPNTISLHPNIISFAALFLDIHISFKMEQNNGRWSFSSRENSYILPMGPIILDATVTSSNEREISWNIAKKLSLSYERLHGTVKTINLRKTFMEKQFNLIEIFEELLWNQVLSDPTISGEIKYTLLYNLINEIR
jgi:hypothetical protein